MSDSSHSSHESNLFHNQLQYPMTRFTSLIATAVAIMIAFAAIAQSPTATLPIILLPELDINKLKAEDQRMTYDVRCAAPVETSFSNNSEDAHWQTLDNGDRIWQIRLQAPRAFGLTLLFRKFILPQGAILRVSNPNDNNKIFQFTQFDNNPQRILTCGMLLGDEVLVEYFEPKSAYAKGHFELFRVYQAYKKYHLLPYTERPDSSIFDKMYRRDSMGFGAAIGCHTNINCQGADTLKNIKRGTARILMVMKEGIGYCTGNLLNNTQQDGKPFMLTGFHCQDGYTPMYDFWRFDFHYESGSCTSPASEPITTRRMTGCVRRAGWRNTDFLLLELTAMIPDSFNLYFNGWDRIAATPTGNTYAAHHPKGDVKKFTAAENGSITTIQNSAIEWNNQVTTPSGHHFKMKPSRGTFEVGSSGCGLYNREKRLVGQLHGGDFNLCNVQAAYFGRFAISWEGGGTSETCLKRWLDPKNKGNINVDGIERPIYPVIVNIACKNPANRPLSHVAYINMQTEDGLLMQDSALALSGEFQYKLPTYIEYFGITPWLDIEPTNGVTTQDIVLIQKHVLGLQPFADSWKLVAGDVNNSGTVTTADIVDIRKMILAINNKFPKSEAWRFNVKYAPPSTIKKNGNGTLIVGNPGIYSIQFEGVKIGDINRSY